MRSMELEGYDVLVYTYRDLFLNAGYRLEAEEVYHGSKDGVALEALITRFSRRSIDDDRSSTEPA